LTSSKESILKRFFLSLWYPKHSTQLLVYFLAPLSWLFRGLAFLRRQYLAKRTHILPVPVVVVGNISVGGAGKTPVVIALARQLKHRGIEVGIISRGYGAKDASESPIAVTANTSVDQAGDEPVLIAAETQCPVVVCRDREQAALHLIKQHEELQVIISDDGLQHYKLYRAMEIVVIDGKRAMGNGFCLPAGPLREPISRLKQVDWLLMHGEGVILPQLPRAYETIQLLPMQWLQVSTNHALPLKPLPWSEKEPVTAIAAIGHPQRFFETLAHLGIGFNAIAFDDHHNFQVSDFKFTTSAEENIVLMTTKDAVKCKHFAKQNWWALMVTAELPDKLVDSVVELASNHH
jgi:tetraacyldisaccharide 4'-kinase